VKNFPVSKNQLIVTVGGVYPLITVKKVGIKNEEKE
jgi:hypothetical protein